MNLYINSFILEKVIFFSKKIVFFLRKNTIFAKKNKDDDSSPP